MTSDAAANCAVVVMPARLNGIVGFGRAGELRVPNLIRPVRIQHEEVREARESPFLERGLVDDGSFGRHGWSGLAQALIEVACRDLDHVFPGCAEFFEDGPFMLDTGVGDQEIVVDPQAFRFGLRSNGQIFGIFRVLLIMRLPESTNSSDKGCRSPDPIVQTPP